VWTHLRATEHHLPYGIAHWSQPDIGRHAAPNSSQGDQYPIYLSGNDGRLSWFSNVTLQSFSLCLHFNKHVIFHEATVHVGILQVISHCENRAHPHPDSHRFEKISNIIKQFKLSCSKVSSNFTSMEVRNSMFAAYIDGFTTNTYVMVIMSDPTIREFFIVIFVSFVSIMWILHKVIYY